MDFSPHGQKKIHTKYQEYKLKTNKRVKEIVLTFGVLDKNERVHVSQIQAINLNEETLNWKKKTFYGTKGSRKCSSLYLHSD